MAKTPTKPRKTTAAKAPKPKIAWLKFLQANPTPYTAIFAHGKINLPSGVTLTKLVKQYLKAHATGKYETTTFASNGSKAVVVAFASKADFDVMKAHYNGKPWQSIVAGALDGFQA